MDAGNDAQRDLTHGSSQTRRSRSNRHLTIALSAFFAATLAAVVLPTPANAEAAVRGSDSASTAGANDADARIRCRFTQLVRNGSFEAPRVANGSWALFSQGFTGWMTNEPQGQVEMWAHGMLNTPAYHGRQFAEINVHGTNSRLIQDLATRPNTTLHWSYAYRARNLNANSLDVDTTSLRFGRTPLGGTGAGFNAATVATATAGDGTWRVRRGTYRVPAGQWSTRLTLTSLDINNPAGHGNLVDAVSVIGIRCA